MKRIISIAAVFALTVFTAKAQSQELLSYISSANSELSEMLDEGMELTSVSFENDAVLVNFTLDNDFYPVFVMTMADRNMQLATCFQFLRAFEVDEDPESRALFNAILSEKTGFGCTFTSKDRKEYFPAIASADEIDKYLYKINMASVQLSMTAQQVQERLPIKVGESQIARMDYEDFVLIYGIELDETIPGVEEIFAMKDLRALKEQVNTTLVNSQTMPLLQLLVQANSSLRVDYLGKHTGKVISTAYTAEEISDLIEEGGQSDAERLESLVAAVNESLPVEVSENITCVEVRLEEDKLYYLYVVDGPDSKKAIKTMRKKRKENTYQVAESLIASDDYSISTMLRLMVNNGTSLVYMYIDANKEDNYAYVYLNPEVLGEILVSRSE